MPNKPGTCLRSILTSIVLLLGLAPYLKPQAVSIASITGRDVDEQVAVLPGAQIKLTDAENGSIHNAVTNAEGIYTIASVPIGSYTLETTAPGFQTHVQTGISLRVGDNVQINIQMKVGTVSERVEVSASAVMLETQQNTISQVVDQRRIVELPLNGRDPTELITIIGAALNKSDGTNTGSKSL